MIVDEDDHQFEISSTESNLDDVRIRGVVNSVLQLRGPMVDPQPAGQVEVMQQRINALEVSTTRLLRVLKTTERSLIQMSGAVILVDVAGQVIFFNQQLADLVNNASASVTLGQSVLDTGRALGCRGDE